MNPIENIQHVEIPLKRGGFVLILNRGAAIDAESEAMLQALHSRSIGGIKSHLQVLAKKGAANFMSNFYVGYGHKSIGDCGNVTIFIEGVSMLVAKAIQQTPLYAGQEASTRYIDFAKQPFVDPVGTVESAALLERWRGFYLKGLDVLQEDLVTRFPRASEEDETKYSKAIKARAFDIMRGFLPSGASTNLAWNTNLRQAADHLMLLRHHPLLEVREVADAILTGLQKALPNSFAHKQYDSTEAYNEKWMMTKYYHTDPHAVEFKLSKNSVDRELLESYRSTLKSRPAKTELPKEIGETGTLQFEFLLDFGSFRDLQRHRAVIQKMPLVTTMHGFEPWYLDELPEDFRKIAEAFIEAREDDVHELQVSEFDRQYYIPMGYRLPNRLTGSIPMLVYLVELRATRTVHPTLRKRAIQMAKVLSKEFADQGLVVHLEKDPDRFDVRRGEHDIVIKE